MAFMMILRYTVIMNCMKQPINVFRVLSPLIHQIIDLGYLVPFDDGIHCFPLPRG